jgi:hypothetical protein
MPNFGIGLNTNEATWLIFVIIVLFWALTLAALTPIRSRGWRVIPTTLFGFTWLGFGLDILIRFLLLSVDSVDFGNSTFRLTVLPTDIVNRCLMLSGLFWVCFVGGYIGLRRAPLPNPLQPFADVTTHRASRAAVPVLILTSACLYLSLRVSLPASFVTPLALLGSLWVLPATILWWDRFRTDRPRRAGNLYLPLLALTPGLLAVGLNPYREWLLILFLVPLIAALFAGIRLRLTRVSVASFVLLLASTALVQSYRKVLWSSQGIDEVYLGASSWTQDSMDAPWFEPLRRFHGFDSFLLTVSLYPDVMPYTGDNLFVDSMVRGLVPRAVFQNKGQDDEGVQFGTALWSGDPNLSVRGASIAPSMPGTLYSAGGAAFVALGAVLWGALVGLCESWKRSLSTSAKAAFTAMWGLAFAASIERGFTHNISTLLQQLIVVSCALAMVWWIDKRTRNVSSPVPFQPTSASYE